MSPALVGPSAGLAELLGAVATALIAEADALNRLDAVAGDGDLGITATAAARAVIEIAPEVAALPTGEALRRIGTEIARRAPSTGGTLVAFAFLAASKVDVPDGSPPAAEATLRMAAADGAIRQRGRVDLGAKTMVDALAPAVEAWDRAITDGGSSRFAAEAAARAGDAGAQATQSMGATVGRAGWLADRSQGHEDAGARMVAVALRAAARHLARG